MPRRAGHPLFVATLWLVAAPWAFAWRSQDCRTGQFVSAFGRTPALLARGGPRAHGNPGAW
jgi:hypothetical protein